MKDPLQLNPAAAVFPVVISGPSGVGKTLLIDTLLSRDPDLIESISATSRPRRKGEEDGVHYFFHDVERFEELIRDGELLEWARVHEHYYGTPRAPLEAGLAAGRCVVLNIDVQGGRQLRDTRPDALTIFVVPPSMDVLESRLRNRGTDSEETIQVRLRNARTELEEASSYQYLVVNDVLEDVVGALETIIRAEKSRTRHLLGG